MNVLVTGGAGFIGSNLVRYLNTVAPDVGIVILDDLSNGRRENLEGLAAEFHEGTLLDQDLVSQLTSGVDTVVHLGALGSVPRSIADPRASHEANITGTLNVLESARSAGVSQVIVASSSSVYGANTAIPKSEWQWTRPMSPYAVTKLATEGYALAYSYAYDLPALAFRFFNVFGPGQPADHVYAAVIPRFVDAALKGEPIVVHGDGLQSRDFTYVDTVCATLHSAIVRRVSSTDPVNLAFGTNTNLLELVEVIQQKVGRPVTIEHVDSRTGDVRASQSDGVRIQELFPEIRPVPLDEGIERTIEWFRQKVLV